MLLSDAMKTDTGVYPGAGVVGRERSTWYSVANLSVESGGLDVAAQCSFRSGEVPPHLAKAVLQAQAELAYEHAADGYPIAGIGYLIKTERPARTLVLQFGPNAGQETTLPAKQVLKFRIAKTAKDIILGRAAPAPDVTKINMSSEEEAGNDGE